MRDYARAILGDAEGAPDPFSLYKIAADAALDAGDDDLAFGLRWLAARRRRPACRIFKDGMAWVWHNHDEGQFCLLYLWSGVFYHHLPDRVAGRVVGDHLDDGDILCGDSFADAVASAALAVSDAH